MRRRLKALRAEAGLSQAALAEKVGVSRNSIVSIENARFDPSLPLAIAIARVFGRPVEDVFVEDVGD